MSKCSVCGRPLSDEKSLAICMGPECRSGQNIKIGESIKNLLIEEAHLDSILSEKDLCDYYFKAIDAAEALKKEIKNSKESEILNELLAGFNELIDKQSSEFKKSLESSFEDFRRELLALSFFGKFDSLLNKIEEGLDLSSYLSKKLWALRERGIIFSSLKEAKVFLLKEENKVFIDRVLREMKSLFEAKRIEKRVNERRSNE